MQIAIRQADFVKDKAAISVLMAELQTFEQTIRPQRDDWQNVEAAYMKWLIEAVEEHSGICYLAEVDQQAVGLICGWIEPPDEQVMDKDEPAFGYISEGVVTEEYRRHGIYQQLMQKMEDYFHERNIRVTRTVATNGNNGVTAFLMKNGFQPYYTCFEKRIG